MFITGPELFWKSITPNNLTPSTWKTQCFACQLLKLPPWSLFLLIKFLTEHFQQLSILLYALLYLSQCLISGIIHAHLSWINVKALWVICNRINWRRSASKLSISLWTIFKLLQIISSYPYKQRGQMHIELVTSFLQLLEVT